MRKMLGTAQDCDAAVETCHVDAGAIQLQLLLGPQVKPLSPFSVALAIKGGEVAAQSVVIDFQMQGMDMGMNRYRLLHASGLSWQGEATIPVCTASRMDWLAVIEFTLNGQPYQAVFPFHTESN
jgi:hypothetical protein